MQIYNDNGCDRLEDRSLWKGNSTGLINLNSTKYQWAVPLYNQLREQFWIPQRIDLTADITDYKNLAPAEKKGFDEILSYLVFLDSIQEMNLPLLKSQITAPEARICLTEQTSQEAMHAQSYQYIIETILAVEERESIYQNTQTNKVLNDRVKYIAKLYQNYANNQTEENYFTSLIANYLLEGVYFYNGFVFFYNLASRQLMAGCADIFKMINRDELSHVRLFQKLIVEAKETFTHSEEQIYELFSKAVDQEIAWNSYLNQETVLGITDESAQQYTKYLADLRLRAIGLKPLYDITQNPYKHLEGISDTGKQGATKANFFEATVTSYSMASAVEGWEEI